MGRSEYQNYEVRIREEGHAGRIKSVFVPAKSTKHASSKIKSKGSIVSVKKVPFEKIFSVGEFAQFVTPDERLFGFMKNGDKRNGRGSRGDRPKFRL